MIILTRREVRCFIHGTAEMLLTGQRVIPAKAQKSGCQFRYPNPEEALEGCMAG